MTSRRVWNRIIAAAAAIAILYLLILLVVRILESKLIFFPDYGGRLSGDWHPRDLPIEDVWIKTADGENLHWWWIPHEAAAVTFIAFHGNAASITNRTPIYKFLWKIPANVLAVEYRGYGRSSGQASEAGLYQDAEAAYDYLQRRNISAGQIVSFGSSLGTAVAADLATKRNVRAIILEAPFASISAAAKRLMRYTPGIALLARSKFETARKIAGLRVPILIVGCQDDPMLPSDLHDDVFRATHEPKSRLQIAATCHEGASMAAPEKYHQKILEFLNLRGE